MSKIIIGVIVVVLVAIGAYFVLQTPVQAPTNSNTNTGIAPPPPPPPNSDTTSAPPDNTPKGESVTIEMSDAGFSPKSLTIKVGTTVIFKNEGGNKPWPASTIHPTHTVYPGSGIEKCGTSEQSKIFDACHSLEKGESWSFTFDQKGTWRYHDHHNPAFFASITVE